MADAARGFRHRHAHSHAHTDGDTLADAHADIDRDRTPGGCGGPTEAGTIVRTLAYHQLTTFTSRPGVHTKGNSPSILSANGSRAAFLVGESPAHVYVINADGTGLREVDTQPGG